MSSHGDDLPSASELESADSSGAAAATIQLSLRAILLTLTSLAFVIAAVFSFPPVLSALIAVTLAVCAPAMLIVCVVYGQRRLRAFAMGMLTPSFMRALGSGWTGSYALYMNSSSWQSYPSATQSGSVLTSTDGYFRTLMATWQETGHALMADETMFWLGSAIAGLSAMAVYAKLTRDGGSR
jgi:hypothetical protein